MLSAACPGKLEVVETVEWFAVWVVVRRGKVERMQTGKSKLEALHFPATAWQAPRAETRHIGDHLGDLLMFSGTYSWSRDPPNLPWRTLQIATSWHRGRSRCQDCRRSGQSQCARTDHVGKHTASLLSMLSFCSFYSCQDTWKGMPHPTPKVLLTGVHPGDLPAVQLGYPDL